MNLAYKKILGKCTKVLGFGKTPPHVGKNSQIISFFSLRPYLSDVAEAETGTLKADKNINLPRGKTRTVEPLRCSGSHDWQKGNNVSICHRPHFWGITQVHQNTKLFF